LILDGDTRAEYLMTDDLEEAKHTAEYAIVHGAESAEVGKFIKLLTPKRKITVEWEK